MPSPVSSMVLRPPTVRRTLDLTRFRAPGMIVSSIGMTIPLPNALAGSGFMTSKLSPSPSADGLTVVNVIKARRR